VPDSAEVQVAVDRLAATLDLSVLIEDRRQRPVWWSTRGPVDQTRTSTILDRHVDRQAADVVRELRLDRADCPVRTPAMPERGMCARWCVPARHDEHLVGFLWVLDPDSLITDEHLALLQECADPGGGGAGCVISSGGGSATASRGADRHPAVALRQRRSRRTRPSGAPSSRRTRPGRSTGQSRRLGAAGGDKRAGRHPPTTAATLPLLPSPCMCIGQPCTTGWNGSNS